ncbi:ester cyclase [Streptomyces spiramyceticus]|uniref:ester cyclase n=1 Tax=Streptomyces spiramyceticus TaxID=299717 RepID=UPI00237BDBCF|nr:nuclear transport factor 2 family protein [Streptomyces spiramyceticus]
MGQARDVMDRLTETLTTAKNLQATDECFAEDAVAITPDQGEIRGRDNIVEYWRQLTQALPDSTYEPVHSFEVGNTAIDEGFYVGKNTGPVPLPSGETLPATQRDIRVRGVDFAAVEDGRIVSYRLYFDQMEFLGQLGMLPDAP